MSLNKKISVQYNKLLNQPGNQLGSHVIGLTSIVLNKHLPFFTNHTTKIYAYAAPPTLPVHNSKDLSLHSESTQSHENLNGSECFDSNNTMFSNQRPMRPSRFAATKSGSHTMTLTKILALCFIALPLLMALRLALPHPSSHPNSGFAHARILDTLSHNGTSVPEQGTIFFFSFYMFSVWLLRMFFGEKKSLVLFVVFIF